VTRHNTTNTRRNKVKGANRTPFPFRLGGLFSLVKGTDFLSRHLQTRFEQRMGAGCLVPESRLRGPVVTSRPLISRPLLNAMTHPGHGPPKPGRRWPTAEAYPYQLSGAGSEKILPIAPAPTGMPMLDILRDFGLPPNPAEPPAERLKPRQVTGNRVVLVIDGGHLLEPCTNGRDRLVTAVFQLQFYCFDPASFAGPNEAWPSSCLGTRV